MFSKARNDVHAHANCFLNEVIETFLERMSGADLFADSNSFYSFDSPNDETDTLRDSTIATNNEYKGPRSASLGGLPMCNGL